VTITTRRALLAGASALALSACVPPGTPPFPRSEFEHGWLTDYNFVISAEDVRKLMVGSYDSGTGLLEFYGD